MNDARHEPPEEIGDLALDPIAGGFDPQPDPPRYIPRSNVSNPAPAVTPILVTAPSIAHH